MFKVGDKVVYPAHGVGVIEDIQNREMLGTKESFYILHMCERDMTIMVPTANSNKVGLREVIAEGDVTKVLDVLKQRGSKTTEAWNRRSKQYMETIKTGCVFEIAKIYRDLTQLKRRKTLSFGEKRVLDNVRELIAEEISQVRGISKDSVVTLLDNFVAQ
ncbi:MAG: CarD family transcriptional regulator [Nitrospinota bacterium]